MPSYAAGPRPATVRLAQTSSQCIKETFNRYLPLPSSATRPANSVAPKPQIIARNRVRPRRSHKPSRSNLHSAPQPPIPYRGFLPWRLSDAGPGASRIVPMGRHPKPFTTTDSCTGKQRGRHSDAEGLRGFEIDDQLEFSRLYNRQVGGLSAFEDFVRVKSNL